MPDYHYVPGYEIPVEVLADSNADVAREGKGVAVIGEGPDGPQVELQEGTSDAHIGLLKNEPEGLRDPDNSESDYSSGDSVGRATLILGVTVIWYPTDSGYSPSVGDLVEVGDGGDIEAYSGPTTSGVSTVTNTVGIDANGNLENDGGSDIDISLGVDAFPDGMVLTTVAREWGVGGHTAVVPAGGI